MFQEYKFILNTKDFKQQYQVETCRAEGKPCNFGKHQDVFDSYMQTSCKQKMTHVKMIVLSEDQRSVEIDDFEVPTACQCWRQR